MSTDTLDPFRLDLKAETPAEEASRIAARMRAFPTDEGNLQYLRKLIYEDSAALAAMIPAVEAAAGAESDITRDFYKAVATCGSAGECSGNTQMWPLMTSGADAVDAALGAGGGAGGGLPPPLEAPPQATASPVIMQDGGVLRCSTGAWTGSPTSYVYQWRINGLPAGANTPIYEISPAAIGRSALCSVSAVNAAGSASVDSNLLTIA